MSVVNMFLGMPDVLHVFRCQLCLVTGTFSGSVALRRKNPRHSIAFYLKTLFNCSSRWYLCE
uniref:Uncharacterized protein n=1 Tax=Arundo donax TaxID=35708 RepID=A0A0A9GDR7_ARUDO